MQVTGTTSSGSSTATTSSSDAKAAAAANIDYNTFLKLLLTQMKNQDPTNPTDPTQYVSQLAQFSSVGQAVQTNAKLDTILTTSALSQADQIIGRTLTSSDGSQSGTVASVTINASGSTATLSNGKQVSLTSGVTVS